MCVNSGVIVPVTVQHWHAIIAIPAIVIKEFTKQTLHVSMTVLAARAREDVILDAGDAPAHGVQETNSNVPGQHHTRQTNTNLNYATRRHRHKDVHIQTASSKPEPNPAANTRSIATETIILQTDGRLLCQFLRVRQARGEVDHGYDDVEDGKHLLRNGGGARGRLLAAVSIRASEVPKRPDSDLHQLLPDGP
eukprot:1867576-Rhodomonas_salina.2